MKKHGVFQRLGKPTKQPKKNVFQRLGAITEAPTRILVSQRLGKVGESSSKRTKTKSNEATSLIINSPVVIFMSSKKGDAEEDEVAVVHHISVDEGDNPTPEEELGEALAIFEEGKFGYRGRSKAHRFKCLTMPGLDPTIAVHKLVVKIGVKPVKQTQRRFHPELVPEIEKEVDKLLKANFIREVKYPSWITNVVPMKKKNGQIRVCVDFRDLNKACPKDDFPLSITKLMVDATTGHEVLSFMDGSSGYNQIRMDPKDEEMTAFRIPKGATYQRAMQRIFDDFLHKFVECYVDDLVVKTKARDDHLKDLRAVFERLRRDQLKMNPLKCAFGVSSRKFLEFVVRHRGIEIDQTKIDVIQQMPEPKNLS
ncbi:hypothetical protein H6P81_018117 [Aristolochia fimbriata]|uniref:Reverse transcriptase domain-containing protein n=1 Tax=Aristolochia fimbriata TaxID=158543 RepID=A0AAV7E4E3_ARIFI|nr:hypothetical protein H6P81_018117 [Aristolochia fimbriata]